MAINNDIKVFISSKGSICCECKNALLRYTWITLNKDKKIFCLTCSDIEHLIFLPSGDTALTRRSRKYSTLVAIVLKWSKARRRYERQGLLIEEQALGKAEKDCFADKDTREKKRARSAVRRNELDKTYIKEFAKEIRKKFPLCAAGSEIKIAEHACLKYSGRVGRSKGAKDFDINAITLAVRAHIRHNKTNYDDLLANGTDRNYARATVKHEVNKIFEFWKNK